MANSKPTPRAVLLANAGFSLVEVGGKYEVSEQYYDDVRQCELRAGILAFYDLLLVGGEPYAVWN